MNVNWKVRIKNKMFWLTLIPAMVLLIQATAGVMGYTLDLNAIGDKLIIVVNTLFTVLTILGVVVDPTTPGINDSHRALGYEKPEDATISQ